MRTANQSDAFVQLITIHKSNRLFYIQTEMGQEGEIAERQRERGRENEHRWVADEASVVKQTVTEHTCFDKQDGQHLERLLLISKMRNLANDISHD
jgi:hypothetical protein